MIERIANGAVEACLTTVTVGEVCHRWMMEECRDRGIVLGGNPAKALAEKRHVISQLSNNNPSRTESAMIERCPPLIVASQWGFPR